MSEITLRAGPPRWRAIAPLPFAVAGICLALAGATASHAQEPSPPATGAGASPWVDTGWTPAALSDNADAPVYRTRLPPATTLNYTLRRGSWSGSGELVWQPAGERYRAHLEGRVAGFRVMTWDSEGAIDAAGIAPVRFSDQRRGKSMLVANLQRGAGKITYSGTAEENPLPAGAQDRLSWMVQIAGIAAADPQRVEKGRRVSLYVTGARGDADVWTFQAVGRDTVMAAGAPVNAIKLLREPRKPRDTRVEVWLDPAQHHLPVRARLSSSDGDALELLQRSVDPS